MRRKNKKTISLERGRRVFVGLSGGVDSSVAALLLKKKGYDVVGVFMHSFSVDGCEVEDTEYARRAAEHLEIPFYTWDFEEEYKKKVVDYMIEGYRRGETPNPDVMCNKEIKFGLFLEKALQFGADYISTGHYVKIAKHGSTYRLYTAKDKNKDQSYFLWTLRQEQLKHALFPIGDYVKPDVRKIAKKAGLPTAEKKDSQGICFLGKVTIADFLKDYIPERSGEAVLTTGEKVGMHTGVSFYTIGQRHLGVMGQASGVKGGSVMDHGSGVRRKHKDRKPFYVARKDIMTNTLVLAEGDDDPNLYRKEIVLRDVHLINSVTPDPACFSTVYARVRYRQPLSQATLKLNGKDRATLTFSKPQKFIASGQSAVFYTKSGEMLGGGVIV